LRGRVEELKEEVERKNSEISAKDKAIVELTIALDVNIFFFNLI
jgi:hypothetical protein